jgi:hypothetical protein
MKTSILSLALGIILASPISAYATDRPLSAFHSHQTMHHRAVVFYGDPFAGLFSPARAEAPPAASLRRDPIKPRETDGLSRNPDDCAYGCIDNGGG